MELLLDIFSYAFTRFHFFWATLLWPWLVAGAIYCLSPRRVGTPGRALVSGIFALGALVVAVGSRAYDHMPHQRMLAMEREPVAKCLLDELQREGPVECVGLIPPRFTVAAPDAYGAYAHAWNINASFVRHFPVLPGAERADKIPPFYQMRRLIGKLGIEEMEYLGDYQLRVTSDDPKLFVDTGQSEILGSCLDLAVEADIRAGVGGPAKLYWLPRGSSGFSEANTQEAPVQGGDQVQTLRFRAKSATGFSHPLRFDPPVELQELEIPDFRVYCLQRKTPSALARR
jgi:hypothetical protein